MKDIYIKENMRRRLEKSSKINISGLLPSNKCVQGLYFESYNECAHLYMLEYDPEIKIIESQPISILYRLNGKNRPYTLDIGAVDVFGKVRYFEVKDEAEYKKPNVRAKYRAIGHQINLAGYEFKVLTQKDLPTGKLLKNLEVISAYSHDFHSQSPELDAAIDVLPEAITVGDACSILNCLSIPHTIISYLLFHRLYECDMSELVNADTQIIRNIR